MEQYVIDTHPLLWYVVDDNRLGTQAEAVIKRAEAGEINIIVPAIVLIEAIDVLNKRRIIYNPAELLNWLSQNPQFIIKNLDLDIINLYKDYSSPLPNVKLKGHDRIILITAQFFNNAPIITKDTDIQQVHSTIW
ncbi:hypothetical protein COX73_02600 [bacterium (Candidatus Gribaldobacteria) CG_4_10_14_0_2_um_filter_36_18]|uniref:PIN domain-containing protein n=1 Tax=bacterium (Candidatus Gribaldobacteria) CG_4_10_14_0_2_um_filter_36_18 TaxID=2014264 RepID=A0A2M7VJS8_9BACT|nr:MAG: hypothetical protein COX73_02600 [bacterium (Candidatus Gribaldobacteria) CG_4_10_14_0_2_um_filter_36_18]